jgi:A/G-specific adenine glycosylase
MKSKIANKLLRWYASRKRSLPWRDAPEPYAVWVAEIMAQQTRLESMLPYFERWMRRFPTVRALAEADEQDVLSLWEGLGYYRRARNLRKAAQVVMAEHGGRLPRDAASLQKLPGIGAYTAGAIASLAFGVDAPAVDGNAIRVLARVFNVELPAASSAGQKRFWELATQHLPKGQAAEYNQALMDLGAQVCTPRNPKCESCPLKRVCEAFALGVQEQRPVKVASPKIPLREYAAAVIEQRGQVLVVQRAGSGLLAGMWEFPNVQVSVAKIAKAGWRRALQREFGLNVEPGAKIGSFEHTYSHFEARLQVYRSALNGLRPRVQSERPFQWVSVKKLGELPMGKLDRRVANALKDAVA